MPSTQDEFRLVLPALDLRHDIKHPYHSMAGRVELFSNHKQLIVFPKTVILIKGSTLTKKFTFDEEVIAATFTSFNDNDTPTNEESLVICLSKSAFIYANGKENFVSFPFTLKSALSFESGLILEKDQSHITTMSLDNVHPQQLNSAKFLSFVDPIGDFRIITSSSTSIISPHEQLMCFPHKALNKNLSLCATFNSKESTIVLYHIKSSSRNPKKMHSYKFSKRKNTFLTTPNPTRIIEDDNLHIDGTIPSGNGLNSASLNMDKKRTSTLLSDASSMARMGSDATISDLNKPMELNGLKKDMILTKVEVLNVQIDKHHLDIYNLFYREQEAIVIMNRQKGEAKVYIFSQSITSIPQYQHTYSIRCQHCSPLLNPQFEGLLVILKDGKFLQLINPFVDVSSASIDLSMAKYPEISYIESCNDENVAVRGKNGKSYIINLILQPSSDIITTCLQCFKYLSGSSINETIWMLWRSALMLDKSRDEWNALIITLLAIMLPMESELQDYSINEITQLIPSAKLLNQQLSNNYSFRDMLPYIIVSLHLIREETKLNILFHGNLHKFAMFLTQACIWMGWPESWYKYYALDLNQFDRETRLLSVFVIPQPPNVLQSLTSLFSDSIISYLPFSQLVEESNTTDELIIPRTHAILKLFEIIVSPNYGSTDIVDLMAELGISIEDLETFPIGVQIPLKEAISICQEKPDFDWTLNSLDLVDRKDLDMFLKSESYQPPTSLYSNPSHNFTISKDINHVLASVLGGTEQVVAWDDQSEADRLGITKLIFDYDRRYYEITSLLHQTKTQTATLIVEEGTTEYDIVVLQRELAATVALRTLSIPLGRASLFYAGRMPLLTEKFPIPKFNLNTIIAPKMTNIVLSEGSVEERTVEWGYFHNGVASGLSISKESKGISGSWIIFNKPPSLNSQHGGFLLGLGLNGHLKSLEEWHIYNYLGPKHPLTSVGLLLGMAASNLGTMDVKLTKVLSVHAVALLPQGANDLNVPIIVQAAGLLGIGLLYLETQHRRMSEILLAQITSTVSQNDSEQINEGYRLAAGISLGFVNLGKGRDLKGLNDTRVVDRLLALATSMKDYQPISELDKSCSGAIIALGFVHMKTEDSSIASKLAIPENEQLLDYIRPDLLLLRCISSNIIMWNQIGNTISWVESKIPKSLLSKYGKLETETLDSDQIGFFNILGGTCLSMAIKYASTHDQRARDTLIYYLDNMMVLAMSNTTNYDERVACHSAINIQNILALGLSIIMAGSGDLETFRRLRVLYGDTDKERNYGNYMAINMALGFLFLGGGQYAFGSSNLAIATLIVSLYPVFPNENGEYEVHLQALRHFWALSVEPRCLVIRDVETHKPLKIPVSIKLTNGVVKDIVTPCLLPNLNNIINIETNSLDHFKVNINFEANDHYLKIFQKSLALFVYKRRNYQIFKSSIRRLLELENKGLQIDNHEIEIDSDVNKILNLDFMKNITNHEKKVYLFESSDKTSDANLKDLGLSIFNVIDSKLELMKKSHNPEVIDDLWNLKLIFFYSERLLNDEMHYLSLDFIESLKHNIWKLTSNV
ncbi:anaphase-promoting complex subunit 1 [[Candida] jaroonii]|uniref:Anaphase-promoting complex subunit 1 n=1 Tax=[Candida] jaroonii TaxID=467808 RepID=A0ACA9YET6_9ASCO|nr:anaphase-promoting complex subunit 1 [[Candida] jaroonii]